ncbi:hypothetical protein C0995_010407 [Termitomyces sp. Mi166|nr:hypothetical protein C0995_010407 [Termitomyces sp. Mi166\
MSTFFATQSARNPEKIMLPPLGPINKRRAPLQLSSDDWTIVHTSASVPPEIALPRGAGEQNNDIMAHVRLPPVAHLIAEVEAIAGQLRWNVLISKSLLQRVMIECQSIISHSSHGWPLYEWRHWISTPTFISQLMSISRLNAFEGERRLTSMQTLVIGVYLEGYNHLQLVMPLRSIATIIKDPQVHELDLDMHPMNTFT